MRLVDENGMVITYPQGFWDIADSIKNLIQDMEAKGVDRSDMNTICQCLQQEATFRLLMLPKRNKGVR